MKNEKRYGVERGRLGRTSVEAERQASGIGVSAKDGVITLTGIR